MLNSWPSKSLLGKALLTSRKLFTNCSFRGEEYHSSSLGSAIITILYLLFLFLSLGTIGKPWGLWLIWIWFRWSCRNCWGQTSQCFLRWVIRYIRWDFLDHLHRERVSFRSWIQLLLWRIHWEHWRPVQERPGHQSCLYEYWVYWCVELARNVFLSS